MRKQLDDSVFVDFNSWLVTPPLEIVKEPSLFLYGYLQSLITVSVYLSLLLFSGFLPFEGDFGRGQKCHDYLAPLCRSDCDNSSNSTTSSW